MLRVSADINKIKCLITESFKDGSVTVEYDKRKFEEILSESTFWEVTKIFEITKEQQQFIINKLLANSDIDENSKLKTSVSETELIIDILPQISDIPYNLEMPEDKLELEERLKSPCEVLRKISDVVYNMLLATLNDFIKDTKVIEDLPQETQELVSLALEKESLQKQLVEENELKDSVKELEILTGK